MRLRTFLLLFVILSLYLFFPNNNSYWDGYSYAAYTKYYIDVFKPHHLLYNPLIIGVKNILDVFSWNVETLLIGKWINSLFQFFNLWIAYYILKSLQIKPKQIVLYIVILGFSFNLWRFGTENETYIVPITFSLLGSLYFIKYLKEEKTWFIVWTSFFAAFACLFHQIHFFWWVGLFLGLFYRKTSFQTFLWYALPAFVVPIVYLTVIFYYLDMPLGLSSVENFIFKEIQSNDSFQFNFSLKMLFIHLASTVRTFVQVHPIIYLLIKKNILYLLPLLLCLALMVTTVIHFFRNKIFLKKKKFSWTNIFVFTHVFILIIQYLFAFYNMGNVEFMVMIPFLVVFVLAASYTIEKRFLVYVSVFLFIWNFSFGIFPNFMYSLYDNDVFVNFIKENPNKTYVIKSPLVSSKYFYATGIDTPENIIFEDKCSEKKLDSLLQIRPVYTDVIDYPEIFNKEKLLDVNPMQSIFDTYPKEKVLEYEGLYGKSTVYKVVKK